MIPPTSAAEAAEIDVLKKFAGMSVRIQCISDWEARRAATNLSGILAKAGWKIEDVNVMEGTNMPDGVTVYQYQAPNDDSSVDAFWQSSRVVDEVVAWLRANDWDASHSWAEHGELKPDEIRIRVGFKPAPYFESEINKALAVTWDDKRVHGPIASLPAQYQINPRKK